MPALLERAFATKDDAQIAGLFAAIDGVAFYHNNGTLALAMIEQAYEFGGAAAEPRVVASLASVRVLNQPLLDTYLRQHRVFAAISSSQVAAAEPSIGEEDLLTLIDGFIIYMLLTSEYFRSHLCGAFRRASKVRSAQEFFIQIIEWVRDELARMKRP